MILYVLLCTFYSCGQINVVQELVQNHASHYKEVKMGIKMDLKQNKTLSIVSVLKVFVYIYFNIS